MTGCAKPFPERLNWYGHHPALYTMAFRAAAEEALVRATLDTYLVRKERGCHLMGGSPAPDCLNSRACASFRYDVDLFSNPEFRQIVTAALQRPCDYLTPPNQVTYRDATARFGMSASANWRILQCDGKQVSAKSIQFDDSEAVLRINFERGA